MVQSRYLLKQGNIVSMDPNIGDLVGDILIEGDKISAIEPHLDVEDAEVIEAGEHVIIPGFIDTHRHLWQSIMRGTGSDWSLTQYFAAMGAMGANFTADDIYIASRLGALDAIDSGVTAVFDWSHNLLTPDHTDAALRALEETGLRVSFGYGCSMKQHAECFVPPFQSTSPTPAAEVRRLRRGKLSSDEGILTLGLAARGPDISVMEVVQQDWALARELGLRINAHIGAGKFPVPPAVTTLYKSGLLGDNMTFGHCNNVTDEEMRMMADHGVTATVTPEDEANMAHGWPPISRLIRAGIWPNIGIDTCIAVGGDQFSAMRFALGITRALANGAALERGENPWELTLSTRDVLRMATVEGAQALGMLHRIGTLTPGKQADIVMVRCDTVSTTPAIDPIATVVHHAGRREVDHVLVAGRFVKRHGSLVDVDVSIVHKHATAARQGIFVRSGMHLGWKPSAHAPGASAVSAHHHH